MPSPKRGSGGAGKSSPRDRAIKADKFRRDAAAARSDQRARAADTLPPTSQLSTLAEWLEFAETVYRRAGLALGQIAADAHDEALYLFLRTLDWPLDGDATLLRRPLRPQDRTALRQVLEQRAIRRIPAAYLTREAWLKDYRFYVDERVLIPRSYFLEIIPGRLNAWFPKPTNMRNVADVCTGSGCLAILLAHHFTRAAVDGIDLSADALAVAAINVRDHSLGRRVTLHQSDVFEAVPVPEAGYDLIVSNPPYEPTALCDKLPAEFKKEPRLALDGGRDGLTVIRKLLAQAGERLAPNGLLLIEVGGLQEAMNAEFPTLDLEWLPSSDGADCVCAIRASRLHASAVPRARRERPRKPRV